MRTRTLLAALCGLSSVASAQTVKFTLVPSASEINIGETVTVHVWADMDKPVYAFVHAKIDVNNNQNGLNGMFSNIKLHGALAGGGLAAPTANNDLKTFTPFQLYFPGSGWPANTSNPIWVAAFDWTATAPGKVVYSIDVLDYSGMPDLVYVILNKNGQTAPWTGIESSGTWTVIPSPSALALLSIASLGATRRRRARIL